MSTSRCTAPLTHSQRIRKREVDRQSQRRLRERRNAALQEAERAAGTLRSQVDSLSAEVERSHRRIEELEAENREIRNRIARSSRDSGLLQQDNDSTYLLSDTSLPSISLVVPPSSTALAPFPFHATLPRNRATSCLLDEILRNYLDSHPADLSRNDVPHLKPLLRPKDKQADSPKFLSRTLTDVLSPFTTIATLPEQVANLYILYKMVHWRFACQEGRDSKRIYDQLPDWLKPIPIQLSVDHPMWMDHVPWPRTRAYLISNQSVYSFESFNTLFTPNFAVNWPYGPETVVLSTIEPTRGGIENDVCMNPAFEQHIRRLENWSINSTFRKKFPLLAATMNEK